jgi:murein DD-endopeptidase MepM/ murein hydrolase activator NlpD
MSPARASAIARGRRRPMLHFIVLGLMATGAAFSFLFSQFPFEVHSSAAVTGLSMPGIGAVPTEQPVLTSSVIPDTLRRDELEEGLRVINGEAPAIDTSGQETALAAPAFQDPFVLYSVQEGDTASAIAARFGIDLSYLLWANPDLRDGELLAVGQNLLIPAGNGILHHMLYGETLSDVAERYGVPIETIINWAGNGITSPDQIVEDALVFVPNGVVPVTILPEPTAIPTEPPVFVAVPPEVDVPPVSVAVPAASGSGLIWPIYGSISSYMDASHPLGIDIDLFGREGAPIAAATSGTVTFAGGNPCCSYGYYVVVMSPDGIETLYAHFSDFAVSVGQLVGQGQTLGYAGCTGYCTGTHLHFEVIDNGVRVNPLSYLP